MQTAPVFQPILVAPSVELFDSWRDAMAEFRMPAHRVDGASVFENLDATRPENFEAWLSLQERLGDRRQRTPEGLVHSNSWWIVDDGPTPGTVIGWVNLRHEFNDFLRDFGGHVGYGVRPLARRQGVATWALRAVATKAHGLGIESLLVTCKQDNEGSRRTIEKCGGALEGIVKGPDALMRRYWLATADNA